MILYHGTDESSAKSIIEGILLEKSRDLTDFGKGFYTTPDINTAKIWASRKAFGENRNPAIVEFYFNEKECKNIIKSFIPLNKMSPYKLKIDWAQFIINNRCGEKYSNIFNNYDNNIDLKYQIVCGKIADGNVTQITTQCKNEKRIINSQEVDNILKDDYAIQYSFHSVKSIDLLKNAHIKGGVWK